MKYAKTEAPPRRSILPFVTACLAVGLFAQTALASLTHTWSGTSSKGNAVSLQAEFTINSGTLTVVLRNITPGSTVDGIVYSGSKEQADVLGSFYFDIARSTGSAIVRPTLVYASATGDVRQVFSGSSDDRAYGTDSDNIKSEWMFRSWATPLNGSFGYGLGTVGNHLLDPYNFPAMGGIEQGIYGPGEIVGSSLGDPTDGRLLVEGMATFTFTGVNDWVEADIGEVAFGLGTSPEGPLHVAPLPASLLLGVFAVGLAGRKLRKFV